MMIMIIMNDDDKNDNNRVLTVGASSSPSLKRESMRSLRDAGTAAAKRSGPKLRSASSVW